jgi:deoxyribodipyrimidine photo-lyase
MLSPLRKVDAHNVVPVWCASDKLEVGARTLRGKLTSQLPRFLAANAPPPLEPNDQRAAAAAAEGGLPAAPVDWESALASLVGLDRCVAEVEWAAAGAAGGQAQLERFCAERVKVKRLGLVRKSQSFQFFQGWRGESSRVV